MVCCKRATGSRLEYGHSGSSTNCRPQTAPLNEYPSGNRREKESGAGRSVVLPHLLKGGGAQLDGDVGELAVALGAEVADDVGVLVGFAQELHLPLGEVEALGQDPLHSHPPAVKTAPAQRRRVTSLLHTSQAS